MAGLIVLMLGYFQTATILDGGFYKRAPQRSYPPTATYTPPGSTSIPSREADNTTYRAQNITPQNSPSKGNICSMCGKLSDPEASFCSECGTRFDE